MKHKKGNITQRQLLKKWLTGDANRHDERSLDAAAKDDPFLAEAIEGYGSMAEADHAGDVNRLKARLRQQSERKGGAGFYLMRIAAVGALLVAAWVVLQQFQVSEKSAAVADAVQSEAAAAPEAQGMLADSVVANVASPEDVATKTSERENSKTDLDKSAKKEEPDFYITRNQTLDDKVAGTEPAIPTAPAPSAPATQPAPEADAALAVEEVAPTPSQEEKVSSSVKPSRAEAKKKADSAGPGAPAASLRKITGKVTDENGQPLIGANVMVSKSNNGAITDVDGSYAIEVPSNAPSLVFSYTGYSSLEVNLGAKKQLDVQLSESDAALSEVVVTAYGQSSGEPAPVESPRPIGGFKQFKQYVKDNLRHPEATQQPRPRQVVRVRFTLQSNGTLSNFKPRGDAPQAYKDEAIRLLREGPRWSGTSGTTASYRFVFE